MKATDWHWIGPHHGERNLSMFRLTVRKHNVRLDEWDWYVEDVVGEDDDGTFILWYGIEPTREAAINRAETALAKICKAVLNEIDN